MESMLNSDLYYNEYVKDLPLDKMSSTVRFFMYHVDLLKVWPSGNQQQDLVKLEQDLIGPIMT